MGIERERKFRLIGEIPVDCVRSSVDIEQVYTNSDENSTPYNRIRKTIGAEYTDYTHCTKYELEPNSKEEIEFAISENQYDRIFEIIGKEPIRKKRVYVSLPSSDECDECEVRIAEVDFYEDGDVVIEVEFLEDEDMESFIPPEWFGLEIVDNINYSFVKFSQLNKKGFWE